MRPILQPFCHLLTTIPSLASVCCTLETKTNFHFILQYIPTKWMICQFASFQPLKRPSNDQLPNHHHQPCVSRQWKDKINNILNELFRRFLLNGWARGYCADARSFYPPYHWKHESPFICCCCLLLLLLLFCSELDGKLTVRPKRHLSIWQSESRHLPQHPPRVFDFFFQCARRTGQKEVKGRDMNILLI